MQSMQSRYAQCINLKHERVGPLFQGRYKCRLVDVDPYALQLTRYIHRNPLEGSCVKSLKEYHWSSYNQYVSPQAKPSWLKTEFVLNQFHEDPSVAMALFKDFHHINPPQNEIKRL